MRSVVLALLVAAAAAGGGRAAIPLEQRNGIAVGTNLSPEQKENNEHLLAPPTGGLEVEELTELLHLVAVRLHKQSAGQVANLEKKLKAYDETSIGVVTKEHAANAVNSFDLGVNPGRVNKLVANFDHSGDNKVDYRQMMAAIRTA